jgi:hypothetical protein
MTTNNVKKVMTSCAGVVELEAAASPAAGFACMAARIRSHSMIIKASGIADFKLQI